MSKASVFNIIYNGTKKSEEAVGTKIEQISENRIKVTVDAEEQKKYGITYENMSYSDGNTRKLCESIMKMAKSETGFSVGSSKLLVEARRSYDGTVTLYMSKIPGEEDEKEVFGQTVEIYDYDSLFNVCCELKKRKASFSSLFLLDGVYNLYFEIETERKNAESVLYSLLEYGERSEKSFSFLSEHGLSLVSGNAAETVAKI